MNTTQVIRPILGDIPNATVYSANCLYGKSLRIMLDAGRTLEIQFLEPGGNGIIEIAAGIDKEDGSCQDICVQRIGKEQATVLLPDAQGNWKETEIRITPAPKPISDFRGRYVFLSNFYDAEVSYEGLTYQNAESAFQAAKTLDVEERKKFAALPANEAKRLGRRVKLRPDWEEVKDSVMLDILRAKFSRGSNLAKLLLDTGDAPLVEGNYWHDNYWGACKCEKCARKEHLNRLGTLLEKVRGELQTTPVRLPTCKEWDVMMDIIDDSKAHWALMYSWCQNETANRMSYRAVRGWVSARGWDDYYATYRNVNVGFRPVFEVRNTGNLVSDGKFVTVGTLYMDGQPVRIPQNPTWDGDIADYAPGAKLEFRPALDDPAYQIQTIRVGSVLIADRVLLKNISWWDLEKQGFCGNKEA
jgi:ribA/ribD-fused uncharacterized protein